MKPSHRDLPPEPLQQGGSVSQSPARRFRCDSIFGFVPNRPAKWSFSYLIDAVLVYVLTEAFLIIGGLVIALLFVLILYFAGVIRVF